MPINNSSGQFSIGRDTQIIIETPFGDQLQLDNVKSFEANQRTSNITVDVLAGRSLTAVLPKGWEGSFEVTRSGPEIEFFFAQLEENWQEAGQTYLCTIYQIITEANGQTTWAYSDVALTLTNGGNWSVDAAVDYTISFSASKRRAV